MIKRNVSVGKDGAARRGPRDSSIEVDSVMSFSLLVFLRWQAEFAAGAGVLRLAGGPEGVHGELELAALVGTTFRLIPCGELQI